jgi:serine/threonine protein kinase
MCIYDNEYIMVTEFLSGGSLFDYLHKRCQKLDEHKIFNILKDVALGMSYLHGKNVLHCDLKSSNVLIDENWNVKLCDFGLSRLKNNKKNKKGNIRVGTPHWMAPEILKGEKYECESDVYSFGILLWEMLTGQIPYKELSTAEIIELVGNDPIHRIPIPNYPNQLFLKIFLCCTERNPKMRPTFKNIVELLEKEEKKDSSD